MACDALTAARAQTNCDDVRYRLRESRTNVSQSPPAVLHSMKSSLVFSALAALVLAATPARALPTSFGDCFPNELPVCSGGGETNDDTSSQSWSSWVTSYGCMGPRGGSPKTYVMTFLPNSGSGFDCSVVWENVRPSCPPSQVPDGGSTVVLLGGALAGFVALRRRFRTV
jgi:hypothetical protein